ncbi:MAG: DUF4870 domain-containing protein [Bacteroidia bacterium]
MSDELNSKYHPVPQPDDITQTEKEDAMGSYLMMFAAFAVGLPLPIINLIAAVVYYILNRKKSRYVKFHCLQSLLSQIPTTIMNAILVGWTIRIIAFHNANFTSNYFGYLVAVIVANLLYIIFSIVAAVKANKGRFYYFLFFGKIAYHYSFLKTIELNTPVTNRPPV